MRSTPITPASTEATIELAVTDDGDGPVSDGKQLRIPGSGVGLAGIRERVFALDGEFHAGAGPAGGFEVRVRFPATLDGNGSDMGEAA